MFSIEKKYELRDPLSTPEPLSWSGGGTEKWEKPTDLVFGPITELTNGTGSIQKYKYEVSILDKWDTILMIEHDEDLIRFADKVIRLDNGKIV